MSGSGGTRGPDETFVAEAERARRAGLPGEAERIARVGLGGSPGSLRGRVVLALALLDLDRPEEARDALLPVADLVLCGTEARGFPPPPPVPHEPLAGAPEEPEPDVDAAFDGAWVGDRPRMTPDELARLAVEEVDGAVTASGSDRPPQFPGRRSRDEVIATLERWLDNLRRRSA